MKKIFSFSFIAASLLFVSCKKETINQPDPGPGGGPGPVVSKKLKETTFDEHRLFTYNADGKIKEIILPIQGYEYKESGNYLIIRRAPIRLTLVTNKAITEDKMYVVTGYVLDDETGYMIPNASIYEKTLLASALTNNNGYFKIRLKSKAKTAALTVSKEFYEDTTVLIEPRYNQEISVTIQIHVARVSHRMAE